MNNFKLYSRLGGVSLSLVEPDGTQLNADVVLSKNYPLERHELASAAITEISWNISSLNAINLDCVYFERLSLDGCSLSLIDMSGGGAGVALGSANQVDDFLIIENSASSNSYRLTLTIPVSTSDSLTVSPPFLGFSELSGVSSVCYDWGRSYSMGQPAQGFNTQNQRIIGNAANLSEKSYSINNVRDAEFNDVANAIQKNNNQLVLYTEFGAQNKHNYSLGFLSSSQTTQNRGGYNSFNIRILEKYAR